MEDLIFSIKSFSAGLNKGMADSLIKPYECASGYNCVINNGSLSTMRLPQEVKVETGNIHSLSSYANESSYLFMYCVDKKLTDLFGRNIYTIQGDKLDYVNFESEGKRTIIFSSERDIPFMYNGTDTRKLKNRRKKYNEQGEVVGYVDANGTEHQYVGTVETYAPQGRYIELHHNRLWIAGEYQNPDRIYFSTSNVYGYDIEDFTYPIEEGEANQHGGFVDVRSYDGGRIIGMKVIFDNLVVFKEKNIYKIYGDNPENFQLVQMFNSNGAIADSSIISCNNGAYFLNYDGIYYYNGTSAIKVSGKIDSVFKDMNKSYAKNAVACFKDNKYYLSIPVYQSEKNNILIEYDTINNSFMIFNVGNISSMINTDNYVYITNDNKIKILGDTGNAPSLDLRWESPNLDFGYKNGRKLTNYIYFRGKGNGKIKFTLISDKATKSLEVTLDNIERVYRKKLKNKGRVIKLIIENINGSYFELSSPEITYELDID